MISALFVRKDSVYKQLGVDCWDIERDARLWPGGNAIIAHPPCRAWGQLAHFAKPREGEKEYAVQCIKWIRQWGGVLEHPRGNRLTYYVPHLTIDWLRAARSWGASISELKDIALRVNSWTHFSAEIDNIIAEYKSINP